jgi:hypothetical protein
MVVNSRPVGVFRNSTEGNCEAGMPLTPLHLLLGRASVEVPDINVDVNTKSAAARLIFLQDVRRQFWNKWFLLMTRENNGLYKWTRGHRDLRIGDIVLMKNESMAAKAYKIARVAQVYRGADTRVRHVDLMYKNASESKFRKTERSVRGLVLILPVEEQVNGTVGAEFLQDESSQVDRAQEDDGAGEQPGSPQMNLGGASEAQPGPPTGGGPPTSQEQPGPLTEARPSVASAQPGPSMGGGPSSAAHPVTAAFRERQLQQQDWSPPVACMFMVTDVMDHPEATLDRTEGWSEGWCRVYQWDPHDEVKNWDHVVGEGVNNFRLIRRDHLPDNWEVE